MSYPWRTRPGFFPLFLLGLLVYISIGTVVTVAVIGVRLALGL